MTGGGAEWDIGDGGAVALGSVARGKRRGPLGHLGHMGHRLVRRPAGGCATSAGRFATAWADEAGRRPRGPTAQWSQQSQWSHAHQSPSQQSQWSRSHRTMVRDPGGGGASAMTARVLCNRTPRSHRTMVRDPSGGGDEWDIGDGGAVALGSVARGKRRGPLGHLGHMGHRLVRRSAGGCATSAGRFATAWADEAGRRPRGPTAQWSQQSQWSQAHQSPSQQSQWSHVPAAHTSPPPPVGSALDQRRGVCMWGPSSLSLFLLPGLWADCAQGEALEAFALRGPLRVEPSRLCFAV
jgi:hypothetical protein